MSSTIPYDPALVLGNIVDPDALQTLLQIADVLAQAEAAHDEMDSFISLKKSIDMTIKELINMNIDSTMLTAKSAEVSKNITKSGLIYVKSKTDAELKIRPLKAAARMVHPNTESPIDYSKTQIIKMPLSIDSIKLDAQYFAYNENEETSNTTMANVRSFVSNMVSEQGNTVASTVTTSVTSQISAQRQNHNILGTLIIAACCSHKNAAMLAPFVLDIDKTIQVWNTVFKNVSDKIRVDDVDALAKVAHEIGRHNEKFLSILSGATYGSSFVGMVHILRQENSKSSQAMYSMAADLQAQFEIGNWLQQKNGGYGVDKSVGQEIKNMLSTQSIQSHINLVTMGLIPSVKSNLFKAGVKEFADLDGSKIMAQMNALANVTSSDQKSVAV